MCGICGIFYERPVSGVGARLERMVRRLDHRGPDDMGWVVHPDGAPQGVGASRLAIVDQPGGAQPMALVGGRVLVVFNGEVYNAPELRAELRTEGVRFRTRSDTEVLGQAYLRWGSGCLERLDGMLAAGIWDRREDRLLLARDRLGEKPLFYHLGPGGLVFASELKALLCSGLVPFEPDPEKVADFLTLGYTPGPGAAIRGVQSLAPGTALSVRPGEHPVIRRYWQLQVTEQPPVGDPYERCLELFGQAVKRCLYSDPPVGIFLSSGLDSAAVLRAMGRHQDAPVPAFNASFQDRRFDEVRGVERSARGQRVRLHSVRCTPELIARELDQLVLGADNLLANPAMIALHALSRRARQHGVKSVLTGGGADELFFGYPTYMADRLALAPRPVDLLMQRVVWPVVARLAPVSHGRMPPGYVARKLLEARGFPPAQRHFWWRTVFTGQLKQALLGGAGEQSDAGTYRRTYAPILENPGAGSLLNRYSLADLTVWWRDMGLYMADSVGMAHSVESRAPFMDHRLVEFVYSLPVQLKLRGLQSKPFLRRAMAPLLPPRVRRQPKRAFAIPLASWLAGPLQGFARQQLRRSAVEATGLLHHAPIPRLLEEHSARRADHSYRIWNLICLVRWQRLMAREARPV